MKPLTVQALPLCIFVCKADQLFFFLLFDSPVVPTPPVKSSSSSCSMGCGCPCPSSTAHAFTRKVLTERLQVPWLPPGPVQETSCLLLALCLLCVLNDALPQQGLAASAALSVRVPGTGGDPHHSLLLRRQAVPATPAKCGESAGRAFGPATRADFPFSHSGKENIIPFGFTP